jgi:hypothetical protein
MKHLLFNISVNIFFENFKRFIGSDFLKFSDKKNFPPFQEVKGQVHKRNLTF